MERRQSTGGQRRLENLRQKRNALRTRSDEVRAWVGGGGSGPPSARNQPPDAAALAVAARRRKQAYALSSSSSSSDCEEGPGDAGEAAPTSQELTAKLFAKLGIKGGGGKGAVGGGFDSDSSWASSPERSSTHIRAVVPAAGVGGNGSDSELGELLRAEGTIAALQQELAAARVQADGTTQQLQAVESYTRGVEVRLHAAEQELAAARGGDAEVAAVAASDGWAQAQELAAANSQLLEEVAELGSQLAAAAAWQGEVHAMQQQLGSMQAEVAESEAARQQQQGELAGRLRERERELMAATARLAAAEAQLAALHGVAGGSSGIRGTSMQPRSTGELLAQFGISQAQLTAALSEAITLLA